MDGLAGDVDRLDTGEGAMKSDRVEEAEERRNEIGDTRERVGLGGLAAEAAAVVDLLGS
jgi:hypothetical protein